MTQLLIEVGHGVKKCNMTILMSVLEKIIEGGPNSKPHALSTVRSFVVSSYSMQVNTETCTLNPHVSGITIWLLTYMNTSSIQSNTFYVQNEIKNIQTTPLYNHSHVGFEVMGGGGGGCPLCQRGRYSPWLCSSEEAWWSLPCWHTGEPEPGKLTGRLRTTFSGVAMPFGCKEQTCNSEILIFT